VNADGTGLTRVTPECNQYGDLAWSPDGRHFAFRRWGSELYVMDTDGSDVRRLLASTPLVSSFAWSPDPSRIAFTSGGPPGIWVVNADDTGKAALVPDVRAGDLSWSPDGREIAFETVDQRIAVATIGTGSVRVLGAGGMARADFQPDWQRLP
jgi:TolB protein